jgi:hypothetical protein
MEHITSSCKRLPQFNETNGTLYSDYMTDPETVTPLNQI